MMMDDDFQDRNDNNLNVNDIDLSLLRLSSPPYFYVSPEISPLKRSSPLSEECDHPKRRKLSPSQNPFFIPYPETHSSSLDDDPTRKHQHLVHVQETTCQCGSSSKTLHETETVKTVNDCVDEVNHEDEKQQEEYVEEEEEDCGEGMRIERSGEGFIIRLKCRCRLAFRVLFSDHHLYFKTL